MIRNRFIGLFLLVLTGFIVFACVENAATQTAHSGTAPKLKIISSQDQLKTIMQNAGDRLLVVDFFAEWCAPCKKLAPVLEEIAVENRNRAVVFKVNIDKNKDIATDYGVRGIPFVVFIRDQQTVASLIGLHHKDQYTKTIDRYAKLSAGARPEAADGSIIDGIRVIRRSTAESVDDIYVFRGETVKLIITDIDFAYSIHIPEYNISREGDVGQSLEVAFKAVKTGTFPIFCNGNCPNGDGSRYSQIIVMPFKASTGAKFEELTAVQAKHLMESGDVLVLDLRTPNEYYSGHIENAKLIPVQQLSDRISELETFKEREILLYCRSGNRSTVAAEILVQNGFKNLYNLRHGIIDWERSGFGIVK